MRGAEQTTGNHLEPFHVHSAAWEGQPARRQPSSSSLSLEETLEATPAVAVYVLLYCSRPSWPLTPCSLAATLVSKTCPQLLDRASLRQLGSLGQVMYCLTWLFRSFHGTHSNMLQQTGNLGQRGTPAVRWCACANEA